MNYEAKINKIEAIIKKIESGEIPLEEVFREFEKAQILLKECETFLSQGTKRMSLLIETLEAIEEKDC